MMNSRFSHSRWFSCVLAGLFLLGASGELLAANRYLAPGTPDGIALLAPPPTPGSGEAQADLNTSLAVTKARTPAEEARALKEVSVSYHLFEPLLGLSFRSNTLPITTALMNRVQAEIGAPIDVPKNFWKRKRPYQVDTNIVVSRPEKSFSYPSGHSTRGMVYALVLSELFPDKQSEIMALGRQIGWDRVLLGVHFVTDIQAGRVLAKAIVHEMDANPAFQKDLAAARQELAAYHSEGMVVPVRRETQPVGQ